MPASLVTDFKCVAQSGPTIDGREIKPEWLTEMAETYNPDIYTAKLWIDHKRYLGSYGSVRALKAKADGDVVKLFAKISPSRDLVERNQLWEDKLHFSIEVDEDFAKTGKFYLGGLAMTDEPASLGTSEMRFTTTRDRRFTARYPGEPVENLLAQTTDSEVEGFFRRLIQSFHQMGNPKPKNEDEDTMDKEQFEKLESVLLATQATMAGLVETVNTFAAKIQPDSEDDTPADPPAGEANSEAFTALQTGQDDLAKQVSGLETKFDTLVSRMEAAVPGTSFTEPDGPADYHQDLL